MIISKAVLKWSRWQVKILCLSNCYQSCCTLCSSYPPHFSTPKTHEWQEQLMTRAYVFPWCCFSVYWTWSCDLHQALDDLIPRFLVNHFLYMGSDYFFFLIFYFWISRRLVHGIELRIASPFRRCIVRYGISVLMLIIFALCSFEFQLSKF
jgi:hypothetical protein